MIDFFRYDARKRIRGSIYLAGGMATLAAFALWAFPSFSEATDIDQLLEAYPEPMKQAFDIRTLSTLEGFLAVEVYVFGWVLLLGLYLAYSGAAVIADDVERGRIDTLLAMPVSRKRLLVEKFSSLVVPIFAVNLITPIVVAVGAAVIGEPIAVGDLLALHILSIPYLFACASLGLGTSVLFNRVSIAQRVALGGTFGLYLLESLVAGTDLEPLGGIAPMRYFVPNDILLDGSYDFVGTAILIGMTVVLVAGSVLWFQYKDIQ